MEASVSDPGLALRVQAVHAVHVVGGEAGHVLAPPGAELDHVAGSQQPDEVDEQQEPRVCEEEDTGGRHETQRHASEGKRTASCQTKDR